MQRYAPDETRSVRRLAFKICGDARLLAARIFARTSGTSQVRPTTREQAPPRPRDTLGFRPSSIEIREALPGLSQTIHRRLLRLAARAATLGMDSYQDIIFKLKRYW